MRIIDLAHPDGSLGSRAARLQEALTCYQQAKQDENEAENRKRHVTARLTELEQRWTVLSAVAGEYQAKMKPRNEHDNDARDVVYALTQIVLPEIKAEMTALRREGEQDG